jgi:hypothetical protein
MLNVVELVVCCHVLDFNFGMNLKKMWETK